MSSCLANVTTTTPEIVIITSNQIYSKNVLITLPTKVSYLSCSLNGTTVAHGSSFTFYKYSKPYNSISGCDAIKQVRTCNNGVLNGSSVYDTASCNNSKAPSLGGEWALVFANQNLSTSDFYIMKYEAKNVGGVPTSQPSLTPWVSISQQTAVTTCPSLGSKYSLITNHQWTAAAREIELVNLNWNTSIAGTGSLYVGHSDNVPPNSLAVSNTSDYYDGTGNTFPSLQRRTHYLANNEVVWDMSGNVWNTINDTCDTINWYNGAAWIPWTNSNIIDYEKTNAGPIGSLTTNEGAGSYYGCLSNGNVMVRGSDWSTGVNAGVFSLPMNLIPTYSNTNQGFRCSYTP